MATVFPTPKPRRTRSQRLLIAFNVVCMTGALATAGALGYSNQQVSNITRVGLAKGVLRSSSDTPPGAALNYLIVGADESVGLAKDDPVNIGRGALAGAFRTDTIMVLRIDPKDGTARVLSFPRDLWVDIPGRKVPNRINSAVDSGGGAPALIETIKQDFGIPIDHYIQVNFAGFKELVSAIGGVPIYFKYPSRVRRTTAFIVPEAGCHTLDGDEALAFVRVRKDYQVYRDGAWHTDLRGDLGRIDRQQYFIQVALKRAFERGIRDPNTLRNLVNLGLDTVKIDETLKPNDIVALGNRFRNFNPSNLVKYSVPAVDAVHGGAQVLDVDTKAAEPILALFRGNGETAAETAATVPNTGPATPATTKLQVLNGGQPGGTAKAVTADFADLGFTTVIPTDASVAYEKTTIRYAPGQEAKARLVARYVRGDAVLEQADDIAATSDADVVVVVGGDWAGTRTTPKPANQVGGPTTTTTTAPTTTTTSTVPVTTTTVPDDGFVPYTPPGVSC